ncbi:MAG: hypothetical protein GX075_09510 [Firmicutes bacterium]|nr:hypothetical protein [Bacillota bacterium]
MRKPLPVFWCFNRSKDAALIKTEEIFWQGPFSWVGFEHLNNLKPIPDVAGVYLFTFEYQDGYIIRSVGVTNSMKKRFYQHTREYRKGNYTVLDVEYAKVGERKEIWHGWEYAKKHRDEFIENKDLILQFVEKELQAYKIFITEVLDRRKRERIEFAIMQSIYSSKEPWDDLVDHGMALRGRFNDEIPIEVKNVCPYKIYGLPKEIEI